MREWERGGALAADAPHVVQMHFAWLREEGREGKGATAGCRVWCVGVRLASSEDHARGTQLVAHARTQHEQRSRRRERCICSECRWERRWRWRRRQRPSVSQDVVGTSTRHPRTTPHTQRLRGSNQNHATRRTSRETGRKNDLQLHAAARNLGQTRTGASTRRKTNPRNQDNPRLPHPYSHTNVKHKV